MIIDTDVGIDVDDAFAIVLALRSPEMDILGFSMASGDTAARAKIADRLLGDAGRSDIPVVVGPATKAPSKAFPEDLIGAQKEYGESGPYAKASHLAATDFILKQVKRFPGEITLLAVGPLSNVGALIDKDLKTFRKLKRVVMMGGWINPITRKNGRVDPPIIPEYNVVIDIRAAQKLFESGVPIYMVPLDSTHNLEMDEAHRKAVFAGGTPVADALATLYRLWGHTTPTLFDPMAVALAAKPELCPVEPLHIIVDDRGLTKVGPGPPNAQVCLHSDAQVFFDYFMKRVADVPNPQGSS